MYKLASRAPSQAGYERYMKLLTPTCAAYVLKVPPSEWAVSQSKVLLEGGALDTQTTNNVGEQLNNALELARRMPTPLGSLHECVLHEHRRYLEIRAEAHACTAPLPPRPAKLLAEALLRVSKFKAGSVAWLDGNVRMKAQITRRSDIEQTVVCALQRVGNDRVVCQCECKYANLDGMCCDHALLMAQ